MIATPVIGVALTVRRFVGAVGPYFATKMSQSSAETSVVSCSSPGPKAEEAEQSREPERRSRSQLKWKVFRRRPVTAVVIPPPPLAAICSRPQMRQPVLKIWQVTSLAPVRAMRYFVEDS